MPYAFTIIGLLAMAVPDDVSITRLVIQGGLGLLLFTLGIGMLIERSENNG